MFFPKSLSDLIEYFKKFPGIGVKTAERLAFSVLDFSLEDVDGFAKALCSVKSEIKACSICGTLTDNDVCFVCADNSRKTDSILVVEHSKDVFLFEKMGNYNGYYHVLGGLISPLDEVGPDDISITELLERIKKNKVKEVVLAIRSGIEADTTSLYIKRLLERDGVVVSRIANGIPIGAEMEYIDALTLETALNNRKEVF